MRKGHICGELDARKITISLCKRSPQVLWAYTFKDVYVTGAQLSRTKIFKANKKGKSEKRGKSNGNNKEKE